MVSLRSFSRDVDTIEYEMVPSYREDEASVAWPSQEEQEAQNGDNSPGNSPAKPSRATQMFVRRDLNAPMYGSAGYESECCPDDIPEGVSPEQFGRQIACGKVMDILLMRERGTCCLEQGSVYGAAVALPQFARTANWSMHFTALAIRGWMFLFANVWLQGFLLYMISKEERVNDKFAGQMHLCNMGAGLPDCPGGPDCVGPRGTTFAPERLYDFDMWITRAFVADSFAAMFPDRADEIKTLVDPGEYGFQGFYLRLSCCFLFIMGIWQDLMGTWDLFFLLYQVPTSDDAWVHHDHSAFFDPDEKNKFENFKFRVAGMPLHWKCVNLFCVALPKAYLWLLMVDLGILFLMETAGLEAMIMNTVALSFILSIDELICESLFTDSAKHMLDNIEPLELFEAAGHDTDLNTYLRHQKNTEYNICKPKLHWLIVPKRFLGMVAVTLFFQYKYYLEHCQHESDGSWISTPLHMPLSDSLSYFSFVFGPFPGLFPVARSDNLLWTPPRAELEER